MSECLYESSLETPLGPLQIQSSARGLVAIEIVKRPSPKLENWIRRKFPGFQILPAGNRHRVVEGQIREYFEGRRRIFNLELDLKGSDFQKAVWSTVARIPFGRTATYGEVAILVGRPRASRAVGAANGANPLPIIIPCHRVVGTDGSLTGYGGGIENKRWLLDHEGVLRIESVQMKLFPSRAVTRSSRTAD